MRARSSYCASCAVTLLGAILALAAQGLLHGQPPSEEFARRQYESGLAFLRDGKYVEALKDFQDVATSHSSSSVADNALLEIALHHIEAGGDLAAAEAAADTILKQYPLTDSAPMAHVAAGRIALARSRTMSDADAAIATFERVTRLFPGTDSVPSAHYYAGEAFRVWRRTAEALDRYRRVTAEYPQSAWTARARVGAGWCLAQTGQAVGAMEELQRVRTRFSGTPEAARALAWNTVLYRLYVRAPAQAPYVFTGRGLADATGKLRDVAAIGVDGRDHVFVALKNGVLQFDPTGAISARSAAREPRAILIDRRVGAVIAQEGGIQVRGQFVALSVPKPDGSSRSLEEIPAAAATSRGEYLVADRDGRVIARFSSDGRHLGQFASHSAVRLAVNDLDDVAALDRDGKSITIFDRDGRISFRILQRGPGYELAEPVDLAYDGLGHLYVLDRGRRAVVIFHVQARLVATFTLPESHPGAFRRGEALAVDSAGRLYIFDDRAQRVLIYR